jgi:hypothetical protein
VVAAPGQRTADALHALIVIQVGGYGKKKATHVSEGVVSPAKPDGTLFSGYF